MDLMLWTLFMEKGGYHYYLFKLSQKYVKNVRLICAERTELKKQLDSPDLHRIIQLDDQLFLYTIMPY